MARLVAFAFALALVAAASATEVEMEYHFPGGITDESEIDRLVGKEGSVDKMAYADLPFHFDMPLEDDFGDMDSFLMESSSEQPGITDPVELGRDDFGDEPPVLCETICRPLNASEAENAAKDAQKVEAQIEEQKIKSNAAANAPMAPTTGVDAATGMGPTGNPMLFLEVEKKICGARGGKWKKHHKTGKHECEPFMQPSKGLTTYDPVDVYGMCAKDFSADYAPCNPYQALALAHLYEVPDRQHYWLWPGGRAEQVKSAALKQEIGNNPVQGLDKCPEGRHVGFFHNWDATHVDSWGCFDDAQKYKVLCCRRR
jgi:hypothetical protein